MTAQYFVHYTVASRSPDGKAVRHSLVLGPYTLDEALRKRREQTHAPSVTEAHIEEKRT